MKKNNILMKIASGKGFYIAVIVSFGLIIFAVTMIYRASTDMLKGILTVPDDVTQQARQNETDEADPRYTEEYSVRVTLTEPETSLRWENNGTTRATEPTTEPVISNDNYILPLSESIIRDYSPDTPTLDITMGDWRTHRGVDFAADEGSEVRSIGNGKVTKVISDRNYGYIIEIDHGDFTAKYCGLEQDTTLRLDDTVKQGDVIGRLGEIPCEAAQESHLHFEIVKDGVCVDPIEAMGLGEK